MTGSKHVLLGSGVVEGLSLRNAVVPLGNEDLDRLLKTYGRVADVVENGFLKVVVFAVATYGDSVVVVDKGGEVVLGFGKACKAVSNFSLCRSSMLEQLYEELDVYIPGERYEVVPIGAVYSDFREYDSGSVGFLFRVVLDRRIEDRSVQGKSCIVSMRRLEGMARFSFHGWSRLIYDVIALRWRMGVMP